MLTDQPLITGDLHIPKPRKDLNKAYLKVKQAEENSCVDTLIKLKKENPAADTTSLKAEIDRLVYELFGFTEEEIEFVEGSVNKL